jgi:hypothetical protein
LRREIAAKESISEGKVEDKRRVTTGDRAVDYKYFY